MARDRRSATTVHLTPGIGSSLPVTCVSGDIGDAVTHRPSGAESYYEDPRIGEQPPCLVPRYLPQQAEGEGRAGFFPPLDVVRGRWPNRVTLFSGPLHHMGEGSHPNG